MGTVLGAQLTGLPAMIVLWHVAPVLAAIAVGSIPWLVPQKVAICAEGVRVRWFIISKAISISSTTGIRYSPPKVLKSHSLEITTHDRKIDLQARISVLRALAEEFRLRHDFQLQGTLPTGDREIWKALVLLLLVAGVGMAIGVIFFRA